MQQYLTKVSTSPTEPVSVKEQLAWLRQESGPDDPVVASLITAARVWAEGFQRSSLVSEQWRLTLDRFPCFLLRDGYHAYDGYAELWELPGGLYHPDAVRFAIELPRGPLVAVNSFSYLDATGAAQTLPSPAYQAVTGDGVLPRLFPADGTWWPATAVDPAAITITFTAGYAAGTLPKHTVTAIKMLVAAWNADREGSQAIPPAVKNLLYLDRAFEF